MTADAFVDASPAGPLGTATRRAAEAMLEALADRITGR
jgi:hypothetical protein